MRRSRSRSTAHPKSRNSPCPSCFSLRRPSVWRGAEHERLHVEKGDLVQAQAEGRSCPCRRARRADRLDCRRAEAVAPEEGDLVLAQAEGAQRAEAEEGEGAEAGIRLAAQEGDLVLAQAQGPEGARRAEGREAVVLEEGDLVLAQAESRSRARASRAGRGADGR